MIPQKISLLFFSLFTSFVLFAQTQKAEQQIRQLMQETPVMGLSVAVVKNNKLIYTNAFGLKDAENNIALKPADIFRIASISKSFSATSIMQLVQKKN